MVMDAIKYDFRTAHFLQQSMDSSNIEKARTYSYSKAG